MVDFGYSLNKSSALKIDNADNELFQRLVALEPGVLKCMACGSCVASCSAGNFTEVNLRRAILSLQRGMLQSKEVTALRSCMLCGKCLMVCPRGINTRHLILSICQVYK